jgi:tetratricopeptide (TPR) repeat protein
MAADRGSRSEERDYYEVLGAQPSASAAELRGAFRDAVLRHHPDRARASETATRRTSLLNRAWAELRDPVRRIHYDRTLERGHAATVDWPLEAGEAPRAPRPRRRRRVEPLEPSPWHQPQWRSVSGFRVPADVFLAGPAAQRRWIVEHHIRGEDWRSHDERYWLRFAARHYREQGRTEEAVGALERLVELEPTFEGIVQADLRAAFAEAGQELRGASLLRRAGERFASGGPQRLWAERELRALLGDFRERRVARGGPAARAENGELLLNFMESLGIEPAFSDVRAAIIAHRRAGNAARAAELVERVASEPVTEPGRWFSLVQLLTEAGELDRASVLLAEIARGDHPEALDPRRINGQPWKRIAAARERLVRARRRLGARQRPTSREARAARPEERAVGAT